MQDFVVPYVGQLAESANPPNDYQWQPSGAVLDVVAERRRQVEEKRWSTLLDDCHDEGELAAAAGLYALVGSDRLDNTDERAALRQWWPFECHWWKPRTARENLVRAAALVIAEIERLDRAGLRP